MTVRPRSVELLSPFAFTITQDSKASPSLSAADDWSDLDEDLYAEWEALTYIASEQSERSELSAALEN